MIVVFAPIVCREVILGLERVRPGGVHRAERVVERLAGKGVNVARFCGAMGVPVRLVAIADATSSRALSAEPDLRDAQLVCVATDAPPRTDVVCLEPGGRCTAVSGIGLDSGPAALGAATDAFLEGLGAGDIAVLAGSLPPDAPVDLHARLSVAAASAGARVIVDASGPWLRAALASRPDVLKATADELATAAGARPTDAWRDPRPLVPGQAAIVLTAGARGARAWTAGRAWSVRAVPQVPVNAIGAGDALTAGLAAGLAAGRALPDALAEGVAWAAARVREFDLRIDPAVVASVRGEVRISRLATAGPAPARP